AYYFPEESDGRRCGSSASLIFRFQRHSTQHSCRGTYPIGLFEAVPQPRTIQNDDHACCPTLARRTGACEVATTMEEVWSFRYSKPALPEGPLVELSAAEMDGISWPNSTRRTLIKQMGCGNWLASTPGASSVTRRWTTCTRRWRFSLTRKAKRPVFSRWARPLNGFSDYESAIRFYKEALALEPAATRTWYLIHNNL